MNPRHLKTLLLLPLGLLLAYPLASASGLKFHGSKTSDIYHFVTCEWAKKIAPDSLIVFEGQAAAESAGYKPCKVCKP